MFQTRLTQPIMAILLFVPLALHLYCPVVDASDVFEATPAEQQDIKTIDEIDKGDSDVFEATPAEQQDIKTVDEIDKGDSDVFEATPAEQQDMKTIDEINNWQ